MGLSPLLLGTEDGHLVHLHTGYSEVEFGRLLPRLIVGDWDIIAEIEFGTFRDVHVENRKIWILRLS